MRKDIPGKIRYWLMVIKKRYMPERMILFGSIPRGDVHKGSDIDIILIKKTDKRFLDRIADVMKIYTGTIAIDPIVYTSEEFEMMKKSPFIKKVLKEGLEL